MRGRKVKRNEEHTDAHRWVVSYADFITLLFAFFVVMYAMSSVNVSKYRSLADGMHTAFNQKSKNQAPVNAQVKQNGQDASSLDIDAFNDLEHKLADLQDSDYHTIRQKGWIEMDIKAEALFASGSADLKPLAVLKLMKLANILNKVPYPIALEGYTDDVPISTSQYPSNWELSSARASAVARVLTTYGVDPNRITVTGYGEQYPVADNLSEDGRSKNRRVNMVIAKDKSIPRLLNPSLGGKQVQNAPLQQPNKSVGVPLIKEIQ